MTGMTAESHGIRKLTIDPDLFMLPGGSKKDKERLLDRAKRAEREGMVTIVDVDRAGASRSRRRRPRS